MKKAIFKRAVSIALSALILISVFSVAASAQVDISQFEKDGITYICGDDNDAHIISYSAWSSTTVNIPETVTYRNKEYTVRSIATGAFYILDGSSSFEQVNIPKTIESIDGCAFKDCHNLKWVNIAFGSELTEIGYEAFSGCGNLTSFSIPSTVKTIGNEAFAYTLLDEITFPAGLESLGDRVLEPAHIIGQELKPDYINYYGSKAQWNALLQGKSIGTGLENTPVYVKATLTFDNMGHGANIGAKSFGPHYKPSMEPSIRTSGPVLSENDYLFMGWYEDKSFTKRFDFSNYLTDDVTVYARWFKLSRTITYKIENGTWEDGKRDSIEVNIPSGQFTYFVPENMIPDRGYGNGTWGDTQNSNPYITYPNDGAVFTYTFNPLTLNTVKWLKDDGSELYSDTYYEGESEPTCALVPEKKEDVQYTYVFEKWDYGTVDGTVKTYKPIFTDVEKKLHTVIWLNDDGTDFAVKTYFEGQDEPKISGSPKKASDLDYDYSFKEWDKGTVDDAVKTYSPIFNKTERPVYHISVGYGKADVTESKQGKLITLTPDEPNEGMRFTGWKFLGADVTVTDNTFIMPAQNIELYATYGLKKRADIDFTLSDTKGYVGKFFTVDGSLKDNDEILKLGGTMTITFSSGVPEAEGANSYVVPVNNGKFSLVVPALNKGNGYVWLAYSGDGEYGESLVSDLINVYELSHATINPALDEEKIKREYTVGEELNTDGLYIDLFWMDASEEIIPVTADMVSGFDSSKVGTQTLTVHCPYATDDELNYTVTVKEKPVETTASETGSEAVTAESVISEPNETTEPVSTDAQSTEPTQNVTVEPTEAASENKSEPSEIESTAPATEKTIETSTTESDSTLDEIVVGDLMDGYKLCYQNIPAPPWMEAFYIQYGKYVFVNHNGEGEKNHGFYVKKDNETLMLSEAFERGITDIEEVVSLILAKDIPTFNKNHIVDTEKSGENWKSQFSEFHFRQDDKSTENPSSEPTQPVSDKPSEPSTEKPTEPSSDKPTEPAEEYDFADNKVIIALTDEAARKVENGELVINKEFFTSPELTVIDVESLAEGGKPNIYLLTLDKHDHKNVLKAVEILKNYSEIEAAEPDYYIHLPEKSSNAKKNNPIKVTAKTKTVKLKMLKKKAQTVKLITVKKAQGKVTYKLKNIPEKLKKLLKIGSKGKVKIKRWKKAKKGTYKFKIKVTAKGNKKYKGKKITKKVKLKIK